MGMVKQPIVWIDQDHALAECIDRLSQHGLLALDTEFERSKTYYPIAGLIQLSDGATNYLIDPVAIDDLQPLAALLANANIIKAVHSCSEDLDVIYTLLGVIPVNVFDTQIAGAIAGHGFSMGFGNIVNTLFEVELPKDVTRSDWLQRPLSDKQIEYAALDVEYLFLLAQKLMIDLKQLQRDDWALQDFEHMATEFEANLDCAAAHLRIKHTWKLSPREYAVMMSLAEWREATARRRDLPRNRVLKEHMLLTIAQTQPQNVNQLRQIDGINERIIRADSDAIFTAIDQGLARADDDLLAPPHRPINNRDSDVVDQLKNHVAHVAEALNLPTEILAKKKDYQSLLYPNAPAKLGELPSSLTGWREDIIGKPLLDIIKAHHDALG